MTKIFGIGLSKTGTTSLTKALEILGYKSIHNPESWLKFDGEKLDFDFEQIVNYDTFTDLEIAYFYKQLDELYPNSKFILTTRPIDSWLNSCRNHFHIHSKRSEKANFLVKQVYGATFCDNETQDTFKQGYLKHEQNAKQYFHHRPDDFLILDTGEVDKWSKLCDFLGKSVPGESYPMANKASKINPQLKNILRQNPLTSKMISFVKTKMMKD